MLGGGLLGSVLLLVAEFTPLLHVYSSARGAPIVKTIGTGSHHSYALVPMALLAAALTVGARAGGSRLALASIGFLGLVALGIALIGDLPAAHASGLLGHACATYVSAAAQPERRPVSRDARRGRAAAHERRRTAPGGQRRPTAGSHRAALSLRGRSAS